MTTNAQDEVILHIQAWAKRRDAVRAVLLTGSRANPHATVDAYSDYDIIFVVRDIHPFFDDRGWLADFGNVLVAYWDPIHPSPDYGIEQSGNVIHYEGGLHIDFTLWPLELLQRVVTESTLPNELDLGYRILLDKDNLTAGIQPPAFQAFIPNPPTEIVFRKVIDDFFSDAPYVAKCLCRDELLPAKWCLDFDMRYNFLLQMLEWRVQLDRGWSEPAGVLGRGLKGKLSPELWLELEKTYTGAGINDNWDAFFNMMRLMRVIGMDVAQGLGYEYPVEMDQRVNAYVEEVRDSCTGS